MPANSQANPQKNLPLQRFLLRKTILWGLCGCLLTVAMLLAAVHLSAVQQRLLQELIKHIEARAAIRIQYRAYRWEPFSELRLDGLSVRSAAGNLLHCQEARLHYHLSWNWPFLVPTRLVLQRPVLYLQKDSRGRWIFPTTGSGRNNPAGESSHRWQHFPWPDLKIVSGKILGFQNSRQILALHNLNGTLSLQMISGKNGPSLKIDLDQWQNLLQAQ